MRHILLVEDDPAVIKHNKAALQTEGYAVAWAQTLADADACIRQNPPDLIVLDIRMPDGSGLEFCQELRKTSTVPVLFLTSMVDSDQIVRGLRAGGDDYLTKPYRVEELAARIEALLRRSDYLGRQGEILQRKDLQLDPNAQRAYYRGKDLTLSPKEFLILYLLAKNIGVSHTSEQIFDCVWGGDPIRDARTVRVHISRLRSKLMDMRVPLSIEWSGNGYHLTE